MASIRTETRHYKTVSGYSSDSNDYVIENGKKLLLEIFGGCAVLSNDIKVEIIWDATGTPEILFVTHGVVPEQHTIRELEGNGTKKLRIKLINDSSQTETFGGHWIGLLKG